MPVAVVEPSPSLEIIVLSSVSVIKIVVRRSGLPVAYGGVLFAAQYMVFTFAFGTVPAVCNRIGAVAVTATVINHLTTAVAARVTVNTTFQRTAAVVALSDILAEVMPALVGIAAAIVTFVELIAANVGNMTTVTAAVSAELVTVAASVIPISALVAAYLSCSSAEVAVGALSLSAFAVGEMNTAVVAFATPTVATAANIKLSAHHTVPVATVVLVIASAEMITHTVFNAAAGTTMVIVASAFAKVIAAAAADTMTVCVAGRSIIVEAIVHVAPADGNVALDFHVLVSLSLFIRSSALRLRHCHPMVICDYPSGVDNLVLTRHAAMQKT